MSKSNNTQTVPGKRGKKVVDDGSNECPSDYAEHKITNHLHHWFGCLDHAELETYRGDADDWEKESIEKAETRIGQLRWIFNKKVEVKQPDLFPWFTDCLRGWREIDPLPTQGHAIEESEPAELVEDSPDLQTTVLAYKDGKPYDLLFPTVTARFPNQKISLHTLLHEADENLNPLYHKCPEDMIRYFHLPANNLRWVEEAIARYYQEKTPELRKHYHKIESEDPSQQTKMILEPQYWRGLEHGVASHAKHMRPRCHTVSSSPKKLHKRPNNLILFMPYFHWETDRRRMRSSKLIQNKWKNSMEQVVDGLSTPSSYGRLRTSSSYGNDQLLPKRNSGWSNGSQVQTTSNLASQPCPPMHHRHDTQKSTTLDEFKRKRRKLKDVLWYAALLYEAMDSYIDERLITEHMKGKQITLHARRTLDQAYYWSQDTHTRDRDQVVYRGTSSLYKANHSPCERREHGKSCPHCTDQVTNIPRVVMVDQLWMWILDERTIITAFPRRWGKNKPDTSGVHKSIRTRLGAGRADDIRTVFDLAIVIFDQCCRVFFDRTKVLDLQPEVMDLFATAIGKVAYKQTIAFEAFWEYTREASKAYRSGNFVDANIWQQKLLDVHPEGQLLRENADIIDELHIMINIKKQQQDVAKVFIDKITEIMDSSLKQTNSNPPTSGGDVPLETIQERQETNATQGGSPPPDHQKQRQENRERTLKSMKSLEANLQYQMEELVALQEAAKHTSGSLQALLSLKQQQASIVGAQEALRQGRETVKQGQSIMLFTVISIIFLPLSFLSSVFGMNVTELGTQDSWDFNDTFKYMFPISISVVAISLIFAFSGFGQAILHNGSLILSLIESSVLFSVRKRWVWAITRTRIYGLWTALWSYSRERKEKDRRWIEERKTIARRERREMRILVTSVGWLQHRNEKLLVHLKELGEGSGSSKSESESESKSASVSTTRSRSWKIRQRFLYRVLTSLWGFGRELREREKEYRERDRKEKEDKEKDDKRKEEEKKKQDEEKEKKKNENREGVAEEIESTENAEKVEKVQKEEEKAINDDKQNKNKTKGDEEQPVKERREVTWLQWYANQLIQENELLGIEVDKREAKQEEAKRKEEAGKARTGGGGGGVDGRQGGQGGGENGGGTERQGAGEGEGGSGGDEGGSPSGSRADNGAGSVSASSPEGSSTGTADGDGNGRPR